jgi:hypothetical protein
MKVTVEYDTVTKKLTVFQDGMSMANVDCVSFYKDCYSCYDNNSDKWTMNISQTEYNQDGTRKVTSTMASIAQVLFGKNEDV